MTIDAIMAFMTQDCVVRGLCGPRRVCGTRYAGADAVRAGFADVWATFPMRIGVTPVISFEVTGESPSGSSRALRSDGTRVEVHGCDVFTFRDGKIALKDSYRKNRPPLGNATR